jgi:hypothetical protein
MAAFMRYLLSSIGLVALACGGTHEAKLDSAARRASAVNVASVDPANVTLADFQQLRWINGPWRGFMADGGKFYEWYKFENDSTILKTEHADSTFGTPTGESRIMLRNGIVVDSSARSSYVATRWDSAGADFAPRRGATNSFTWAREDATKWSATIRWTDANGQPQTVLYALHRFGR